MVKNKTLAKRGLLVLALGNQSAHLPGNSYCIDYIQFVFTNNHTVFGIFCFNKLHPIRYDIRISSLLATIMLSFAVFNALYYYFQTLEQDENNILSNSTGTTDTLAISAIGSVVMVIVDFIIWFYVALPCCLPGHNLGGHSKSRWIGKYIVLAIALLLCTVSFIIVLRDQSSSETSVRLLLDGGAVLFAISIFGLRIVVSSILFFWNYKRDHEFYETQVSGITGSSKGVGGDGSDDDSDYSVQERDLEVGSDDSSIDSDDDTSGEDSDSDLGGDDSDDGSMSDDDYSTDESD